MFGIKQYIEFDKTYNIIKLIESKNNVIVFWERFYYENSVLTYSEDSNRFKYLYKNSIKVDKEYIFEWDNDFIVVEDFECNEEPQAYSNLECNEDYIIIEDDN